jgi:hypothetical protein
MSVRIGLPGTYTYIFVQLGLNLSNGETDTLESSSRMISLEAHKTLFIYTVRWWDVILD